MPLGHGIAELWEAVRDRIELTGAEPTWEVTAGSFDDALAYARRRFGDPVVLARRDRTRWWPRVTLTVTTDPGQAGSAPLLEELERPGIPAQRTREMPPGLAAIFDHQEELRIARQRASHDGQAVGSTQPSRGQDTRTRSR